MRANRSVSGLEVRFRRSLWAAGARGYRLHADLPGRPDIVFPRLRLAVLVHGCFWHGCPLCQRRPSRENAEFWATKLAANAQRDTRNQSALEVLGWDCVVVWEHDIRPDPSVKAAEVAAYIRRRRLERGQRLGASPDVGLTRYGLDWADWSSRLVDATEDAPSTITPGRPPAPPTCPPGRS